MRIAMVHSFYSAAQPSGENRVVEDQVGALRGAGHEVLLVRQDSDALKGRFYGVCTAVNVAVGGGFDPTRQIEAFRPDIVHVQNLFPNIATEWMARWSGPIVVSIHNYRACCSNGLFYRNGAICTECAVHGSSRAVAHACYRGSRVATLPIALSRARTRRVLLGGADAVVTTSELSDEVMHRYVASDLRTVVIPNFGPDEATFAGAPAEPRYWITMGRFSPEKGFAELMADWPLDERLIIVGDGPERETIVEAARGKQIEFRSTMPRDELRALLAMSFGLIFPSRWFESDPQVAVEAMRVGLPIIAFHVNAVARIVEQCGAGAVYQAADSLSTALDEVIESRTTMSAAAIAEFERRWTKVAWLRSIEALYRQLVGDEE